MIQIAKLKICYSLGKKIPSTCTVMVVFSVIAEPDIVLVPVHKYTPLCVGYWALTMCSVDITRPGVVVSVGLVMTSV